MLLQLSGIGPAALLREKGVEPKINLPVGTAAQTCLLAGLIYLYTGVPNADENNNTLLANPAELDAFRNGEASLYGVHPSSAMGRDGDSGYIITTFALNPVNLAGPAGADSLLGVFCTSEPRTFSSISIRDTSILSVPDVSVSALEDEEELNTYIWCLQNLERIGAALPASLGATQIVPPSLTRDYLRDSSSPAYHMVGGCAIGSVLTNTLHVKGVENLRVVDASAIPTMPGSAGPLSSVYLLAEYAAELIAAYYRESDSSDD